MVFFGSLHRVLYGSFKLLILSITIRSTYSIQNKRVGGAGAGSVAFVDSNILIIQTSIPHQDDVVAVVALVTRNNIALSSRSFVIVVSIVRRRRRWWWSPSSFEPERHP